MNRFRLIIFSLLVLSLTACRESTTVTYDAPKPQVGFMQTSATMTQDEHDAVVAYGYVYDLDGDAQVSDGDVSPVMLAAEFGRRVMNGFTTLEAAGMTEREMHEVIGMPAVEPDQVVVTEDPERFVAHVNALRLIDALGRSKRRNTVTLALLRDHVASVRALVENGIEANWQDAVVIQTGNGFEKISYNDLSKAETIYQELQNFIKAANVNEIDLENVVIAIEGNVVTLTQQHGLPIYYTTDETTPTRASKLYDSPFSIEPGTTIKAISIYKNHQSNVETEKLSSGDSSSSMSAAQSSQSSAVSSGSPDDTIAFPDENLTQSVRNHLGLTDGQVLTRTLVESLEELTEDRLKIYSLEGIETLSGLKRFHYYSDDDTLSDISPLSRLPLLNELILYDEDNIQDFSPIASMTNLISLNLDNSNHLEDISFLESLTQLENLIVRHTGVSSVESLKNLSSLLSLDISFTNVSDVSALWDMPNLSALKLTHARICDIASLERSIVKDQWYYQHTYHCGDRLVSQTGVTQMHASYDDGCYQSGQIPKFRHIDEVVVDFNTGLVWQDDVQVKQSIMNYHEAEKYCEQGINGFYSWRVPTYRELTTLFDYNDASYRKSFENTLDESYWTATSHPTISNVAKVYDFTSGTDTVADKNTSKYFVRCVHGDQKEYIDEQFETVLFTVNDTLTQLQWHDYNDAAEKRVSWEEALNYCDDLSLSTYTDWRLPNVNELRSLFSFKTYSRPQNGSLIEDTFKFSTTEAYWTSTTLATNTEHAYLVHFGDGSIQTNLKTHGHSNDVPVHVRCVRRGTIHNDCSAQNVSSAPASSSSQGSSSSEAPQEQNTLPVLKTMQSVSQYDNDDGDYQLGKARSYTKADGVVYDEATGLTWEAMMRENPVNVENAFSYCDGLSLDSKTDWRVPDIRELASLVYYGAYGKSPAIDINVFSDAQELANPNFWTSTESIKSDAGYWFVNFDEGYTNESLKTSKLNVRCVSGLTFKSNMFDRSNDVVTDHLTQLQWQDNVDSRDRGDDWGSSIDYCEGLELDGKTDWRMPNIIELKTIVDYGRSESSIYSVFQFVTDGSYWSSTTLEEVTYAKYSWSLNFGDGKEDPWSEKISQLNVRCVRDVNGLNPSKPVFKTGQTTQYATNDDGHLQKGSSHLFSQDNGTIIDSAAQLMWQNDGANTVSHTWQEAVDACNALVLDGHEDWFLPNIHQLSMLIHYEKESPAFGGDLFIKVLANDYWADTKVVTQDPLAWYVDFDKGEIQYGSVDKYKHYRCVREMK